MMFQATLTQMADPESIARKMLKSKHTERIIAKAVTSATKTNTAAVEQTVIDTI